jgi:hypothetical protein
MEDNKILKLVYTFFVGVLLAIFVGVGINSFYPEPKYPEYPSELGYYTEKPTSDQQAKQAQFERESKDYMEVTKTYNRNVSILTLISAVILLVISVGFEKRIKLIADGIMLGGLFTLLYSIGRGFASDNSRYVFIVVSVGLVVVLYIGYHKFVAAPPVKKVVRKKGK